MRVYRGPSKKEFYDDSHELVDTKDLSQDASPWSTTKRIKVNVSKEGYERESVVHIEFEPNDVIALHQALMKGLAESASKLGEAKKVLREIRNLAMPGENIEPRTILEAIRKKAESAV